jgi:hypothetical protein
MPSGGVAMSKLRRSIAVKVGVVLAVAAIASLALMLSSQQIPAPSAPFPTTIRGVPVAWEPDEEVRRAVDGIRAEGVEVITLIGGGPTGVPSWLEVSDERSIELLLFGMSRALRRTDRPTQWESGMSPTDQITIHLRSSARPQGASSRDIQIVFCADVYEGAWPLMVRGTISPEFQDALRHLGIPDKPPKSIPENLVNELKATMRNYGLR